MSQLVLLPIEAFSHVKDNIRGIYLHRKNIQRNKDEVERSYFVLGQIEKSMEVAHKWLTRLDDIDSPQKDIATNLFIKCKQEVNSIIDKTEDIKLEASRVAGRVFPTILQDKIDDLKSVLESVSKHSESLDDYIVKLHDISQAHEDKFLRVKHMVPRNPPRIFLDYEDSSSLEFKLKEALLQDSTDSVSVVGHGMGGVGKTCALRGIASLQEVRRRFSGGILYMSLGAEATKSSVIKNLAIFVRRAGGKKKSHEIEKTTDIQEAVQLTTEWFEDHDCLFLIDDIWQKNGIDTSVAHHLKSLVPQASRSKVAFTTRDKAFSSDHPIRFGKRGDTDSKKILRCSSGGEKNCPTTAEGQKCFERLVEISEGIAISLSVIGSRVFSYIENSNVTPDRAYEKVLEEFSVPSAAIFDTEVEYNGSQVNVMKLLMKSVEILNDECVDKAFVKMFSALSIINKRQEVPFSILERMWNLSMEETIKVVKKFEQFSIVEVLERFHASEKDRIVIHDLLLDCAVVFARKEGDNFTSSVSKQLLLSYVTNQCPSNFNSRANSFPGTLDQDKFTQLSSNFKKRRVEKTVIQNLNQYSISVPADTPLSLDESILAAMDNDFLVQNIFRLCKLSNLQDVGLKLLMNAQWISTIALKEGMGRRQINEDLNLTLEYLESVQEEDGKEKITFLFMLRSAISESERHFMSQTQNLHSIWTELYGRLCYFAQNKFVQSFLSSVKKYAPPGYLKIGKGAFPVPNPSSGKRLVVGGEILDVSIRSNVVEIIRNYHIDGRTNSRTSHKIYLDTYSEKDDSISTKLLLEVPKHNSDNSTIDHFSTSSNKGVFSLNIDGQLLLYKALKTPPLQCSNESSNVSTKYVVFTIDMPDGTDCSENSKEKSIFRTSYVTKNGKYVVAGDWHGNIQMVELREDISDQDVPDQDMFLKIPFTTDEGIESVRYTPALKVEPNSSFTSDLDDSEDISISCLWASEDGHRVIFGSRSLMVYLCNYNGNSWGLTQLYAYSDRMVREQVSDDGLFKSCVSEDHVISEWEWNGHSWELNDFEYRLIYDKLTCLWASDDGRRIISGGRTDQWQSTVRKGYGYEIRVWDWNGHSWERTKLSGHSGNVLSISASKDGNRVISSSQNGEIFVWNWNGSSWARTVLEGKSQQLFASNSETVIRTWTSDDGRHIFSSRFAELRNWNWNWNKYSWEPTLPSGHKKRVNLLWIHDDGRRVVSASYDNTVGVWDWNCHSWEPTVLSGHTANVRCLLVVGDGCPVITGSMDKTVRIWDCNDGSWEATVLSGHTGAVSYLWASENGRYVISGCSDSTVRVWDSHSWEPTVLSGPNHNLRGEVNCLCASEDVRHVVTICGPGHVRLWKWDGQSYNSIELLHGQGFYTPTIRSLLISEDNNAVYILSARREVYIALQNGEWKKCNKIDIKSSFSTRSSTNKESHLARPPHKFNSVHNGYCAILDHKPFIAFLIDYNPQNDANQ